RYRIPVVLELGGKDPMIVLEDADVPNAALGAVWGAFANCGQACASVEHCYVHESIATPFIDAVVAETKRLRQGLGTEPNVDVGSMKSERQLLTVERHIDEAVGKGATVLAGGHRTEDSSSTFFQPTVPTNVNHEMTLLRDDTFGPVLTIMTFKTTQEWLRLANDRVHELTGR